MTRQVEVLHSFQELQARNEPPPNSSAAKRIEYMRKEREERRGIKPARQIVNGSRICAQCGQSDLKCAWSPDSACRRPT